MAAGALTEVAVEEVAANLEEVAQATRKLNPSNLSFALGGLGVGLAAGFYFGRKWSKEKLRAEAFAESEAEVEAIRETYRRKEMVLAKKELEEVIEERGYSTHVDIARDLTIRSLPAPVPVSEPVAGYHKLEPAPEPEPVKDKDDGWDYEAEIASRSPERPYVIHQDEYRDEVAGLEQAVLTFWAEDEVLTDENNNPLPHADQIIGQANLKWGHGADDVDTVYVRNNMLEKEFEICRTHRSFGEEILGQDRSVEDELEHSSQRHPARKRRRTQ